MKNLDQTSAKGRDGSTRSFAEHNSGHFHIASKLGLRESKALFLAGLASAAALAAAGLSFGPNALRPWVMAFTALLLAGSTGAVTAWVSVGRPYVLPLALLLLPLHRVILAAVRHGLPPWRFSPADWILGDEFPLWAAAISIAAAYAGALARCYIKAVQDGEAVQARLSGVSPSEPGMGEGDGPAVSRLVFFPFFFGAIIGGMIGVGQEVPVRISAAVYFLAGARYIGLVNARRRQNSLLSQGTEIGSDLERGWWRGHATALWILLALLPLLPGGFRPIDPRGLIRRWLGTTPPSIDPRAIPRLRVPEAPPGILQISGWFGRFMAFVFRILAVLYTLLGICLALAAAYFLLRGTWLRLKGWRESLGPLWEEIRRFWASLLALLCGALSRGREALHLVIPGSRLARRRGSPGSRRRWPSSRIRMLFARLVFWGREEGLILPPTFAPTEIAEALAGHVPERREDLAYLVEIYHRERYGELEPSRRERRLYRQAWERVLRSGSGDTV